MHESDMRSSLTVVVLLLLLVPGIADIGDTEPVFRSRYAMIKGGDYRDRPGGSLVIRPTFAKGVNGKCVKVEYFRDTVDVRSLTDDDPGIVSNAIGDVVIKRLLQANGRGQTWTRIGDGQWETADKKLVATYELKHGRTHTLTIQTRESLEDDAQYKQRVLEMMHPDLDQVEPR
jgi:hypothetical protein